MVDGVQIPDFLVTPAADAAASTPPAVTTAALAGKHAIAAVKPQTGVEDASASPGVGVGRGVPGGRTAAGGDDGHHGRRSASTPTPTHPTEHPLWSIQSKQIFIGMVAACVNPKPQTVRFIEDLDAAGIRFVHFSAQSMRRSKLLAEKMGIETDWNCAISLRPPETAGVPDPHRMKVGAVCAKAWWHCL